MLNGKESLLLNIMKIMVNEDDFLELIMYANKMSPLVTKRFVRDASKTFDFYGLN